MSRTSIKLGSAAEFRPSVSAALRPPALSCAMGSAPPAAPARPPAEPQIPAARASAVVAWPTGAPTAPLRSPQPRVSAQAETPPSHTVFETPATPRHASHEPQLRPGSPIQQVLRDLRPRARVLAIVSGKGGVGKTSLAVNLAIGLAAAGRRVLLVDADIGLANVDLLLGQRPRGDLGHVLTGRMALADIVQEGPAGIAWIPGASQMPALARIGQKRRDAVLEDLSDLETQHDLLVLDAPAGIGRGVLGLTRLADELVVVTTPEPTSLVDAYALLKATAASGAPGAPGLGQVRLIVNMVAHRRDVERVHSRLREAAGRFLGVPVGLLGYVFCDGHVGRAVQRQEPLLLAYPHSQAAWCVKRLVSAVLEGPQAQTGTSLGFFQRMVQRFAAG
jgi:flagellar biosynthesis protein FlhG